MVTAGPDSLQYQYDIVVFLRLSRAVSRGISSKANSHFSELAR